MFAVPPDLTLSTYDPFAERRGREETARATDRPSPVPTTVFVSFERSVPRLEANAPATATSQSLGTGAPFARGRIQEGGSENDIGRARDERIALLARAADTAPSVEDAARFRLLTDRLRRLAPRVTAADFDQLEGMVGDAERVEATIAELRRKYGA